MTKGFHCLENILKFVFVLDKSEGGCELVLVRDAFQQFEFSEACFSFSLCFFGASST